ncbi:hypothetical protein [Streptomyces sp. DSM 118148]|uniref:hypothetical protein n=1 Tax=Streptomyces sp. DSM 118148 TaxID=3448667 RepID=UPI004040045C
MSRTRSPAGLPEMCGLFLPYSWGDRTCALLTRQTQPYGHSVVTLGERQRSTTGRALLEGSHEMTEAGFPAFDTMVDKADRILREIEKADG